VTLKPPFNQAATEEEIPDPNACPASVDPRQMSLFAAAWTVGSIRSLASGGASSVTYYETTGWRGLLETEGGSPMPDRFRSKPGTVFPVYHVFADLGEFLGGEPIPAISGNPLRVQGLGLRSGGQWRVLVANLVASSQRVVIGPLPGRAAVARRLHEGTARVAMFEPARFREALETMPLSGREMELDLGPYETVCLDVEE
jgi:hypothetical protein